jgi:hypothetical protein
MPAPRVLAVSFTPPPDPASGEARVTVALEGGKQSVFTAATYDRPEAWVKAEKGGYWLGEPVLFVSRLDEATVRAAVDAMAGHLGGYWLRYYRALPGEPSRIGLGHAALDRAEPGCAVVEAVLKDGREFSMLAATPRWWREELTRRKAPWYFGPLALFLKKLDGAHAKRAAQAMAEKDEQLFCRYDTPRRTLPEVLDQFSAKA